MANHYINLDFQGQKKADQKLIETIRTLDKDDELIISMASNNSERIENVTEILVNNGYEYLPKGNGDGTKYSIIAQLKH